MNTSLHTTLRRASRTGRMHALVLAALTASALGAPQCSRAANAVTANAADATTAPAAGAADAAHQRVHASYVAALNQGDAQAAALLFAPGGVIRGGRLCPLDNPCRGAEDLRQRYFVPMAQLGLHLAPTEARSQGDTLTVRMEARSRAIQGTGVDRAVVVDRLVIRSGRIESIDSHYDDRDPETARYLAWALPAPARQ